LKGFFYAEKLKKNRIEIMLYKIDNQAKGTRIISGEVAKKRRSLLNQMIELTEAKGFNEIILPSIEPAKVYVDKAGAEILNQMYNFKDKGDRDICLRPEATATVQLLAQKYYRTQKDVKFWYFERCWRYEKSQYGRYREFFQFGVEWINPSDPSTAKSELIELSQRLVALVTPEGELNANVKRGLSYYVEDGFEISVASLGAQKQVVGGGAYKEGIGFAVGFDRIMLC
jgi:histidyl-tRNA synthetase